MKKIDWKKLFSENYCSFEVGQKLGLVLGLDPTHYTLSYSEQGELGDGAYLQEQKGGFQTFYPALNLTEAMLLFYHVVPGEPEVFETDKKQILVKCGYWETTADKLVDAICEMYILINQNLN